MKPQWILMFLLALGYATSHAETQKQADKTPVDPLFRYEHYYVDYFVKEDGSSVETVDFAIKALKDSVLDSVKRDSVTFSSSIEKVEVLSAYTQKADGTRIDAPKSNYQVEINQGKDQGGPVFSDQSTLTVVYPDVEVGDTVFFSYKRTATEPMFPKQFSTRLTFGERVAFDDVKVSLSAPSTLALQLSSNQMEQSKHEADGRKIYQWTWKNSEPVKKEYGDYSIVVDLDQLTGVSISTFKSYADIARAYGERAVPKAEVTERIRTLADELTRDAKTPYDKAKALYDWVSTHISYAGHCIGVGAVVPHDTAFILDNRMGDCKDHATLLEALLAAEDIASTQALINSGNTYTLPKVPVVSTVNHVINYIPSLNLFVDSTADDIPFGLLPLSDSDKDALLVSDFKADLRTPATPAGLNQQHMVSELNINSDGSVDGTIEVSLKGMFAVKSRSRMRDLPKEVEDTLVQKVFEGYNRIGSGTFEKDDPTERLDVYHYKVSFHLDEFIQRPGAGAFQIDPLFYSESPVRYFLGAAVGPAAITDHVCISGISVEEYTFHFPDDMKILAVPDDAEVIDEPRSYKATYVRDGNLLKVKRSIEDRTQRNVCSPADSEAEKRFAAKVLQNVKYQVVYQ